MSKPRGQARSQAQDEAWRRFEERLRNPIKCWKLSHEDFRNHGKWTDYAQAIEDRFAHPSINRNPWHVIPVNDKHYARVESLRTISKTLSKNVGPGPRPLDAQVIKEAIEALGIDLKDLKNHNHVHDTDH